MAASKAIAIVILCRWRSPFPLGTEFRLSASGGPFGPDTPEVGPSVVLIESSKNPSVPPRRQAYAVEEQIHHGRVVALRLGPVLQFPRAGPQHAQQIFGQDVGRDIRPHLPRFHALGDDRRHRLGEGLAPPPPALAEAGPVAPARPLSLPQNDAKKGPPGPEKGAKVLAGAQQPFAERAVPGRVPPQQLTHFLKAGHRGLDNQVIPVG